MLGYCRIGLRFPYIILVTSMIIKTVVTTLYYFGSWVNILKIINGSPTNLDLFGAFEFPNRMCLSGCFPTPTVNESFTSLITYSCSNFENQEISMFVVFLSGITMLGYYSIGSRFPYNIPAASMIVETVVMTLYYICFWLNILDNTNATPTEVVLFGAFEFPNRMCLSGCYSSRTRNRSYICLITYSCSNFQ